MEQQDVLSRDQCEKVLERYTHGKNFNIKFYSVNPLHSQLEGLLSAQYILKIHYEVGNEEKIVQFFLKTLSEANPIMYSIARSIYAYEKESFYYETVVPMLKSKAFKVDYVGNSYLSESYMIVLEDLSLRYFKTFPKNKPLDLQHCKKCLEILAKFHAQPLMYERERSKELGESYSFTDQYSDILEDKVFSEKENGATKFMKCSVKSLFLLIDLIPENGVTKDEFKGALKVFLDVMMSSKSASSGITHTFLHGDLWSNNFLHKYENDNTEITDTILIDYQTLAYGPPAFDVLQFLFTNTRKEFREAHRSELLTHYYNCFSDLLSQRGFVVNEELSECEFWSTCEEFALPAKVLSVVDRGITFMVDEDHLEALKSQEDFSKYLFEDRGSYMVSAFKRNEQFNELMTEDLTELRDMLFAK